MTRPTFFLFVFGLLLSIEALPQNPAAQTHLQPTARRTVRRVVKRWYSWELNADWLNGLQFKNVSDHPVNANNRILKVPDQSLQSDLRLNFKWKTDKSRLIVRSRGTYQSDQIKYTDDGSSETQPQGKLDLTEAYADTQYSDSLTAALGLQNYQWGPAELISPSNPFFHFSRSQKSVFYVEKGKVLARINVSNGESLSFIFLHEFMDTQDPFWIAQRQFEKISAVKAEYRSTENANRYIGVTIGEEEGQRTFFGEYLNYAPADSWSLYLDGRHTMGTIRYKPMDLSPTLAVMSTDLEDLDRIHHLVVAGVRYEGNWDLRFEFLHNSAGYTEEQLRKIFLNSTPTNPFFLLNLVRFSASGLEVPQQNYAYLSMRKTDFIKKEASFAVRSLNGLSPSSGAVSVSLEWPLSDRFVLFSEAGVSYGSLDSEFSVFEKASFATTLKASF